jgi:hypothetical protein
MASIRRTVDNRIGLNRAGSGVFHMNAEELAAVMDELLEILHLQARQLENLTGHIEQVTTRLPEESEMSVVRSTLAGLHQRVKKLRGV